MQEGPSAALADADKQEGDEEGEESDVIGDEETEEEGNTSEQEEVKAAIPIPVQPRDHTGEQKQFAVNPCVAPFSPRSQSHAGHPGPWGGHGCWRCFGQMVSALSDL